MCAEPFVFCSNRLEPSGPDQKGMRASDAHTNHPEMGPFSNLTKYHTTFSRKGRPAWTGKSCIPRELLAFNCQAFHNRLIPAYCAPPHPPTPATRCTGLGENRAISIHPIDRVQLFTEPTERIGFKMSSAHLDSYEITEVFTDFFSNLNA